MKTSEKVQQDPELVRKIVGMGPLDFTR